MMFTEIIHVFADNYAKPVNKKFSVAVCWRKCYLLWQHLAHNTNTKYNQNPWIRSRREVNKRTGKTPPIVRSLYALCGKPREIVRRERKAKSMCFIFVICVDTDNRTKSMGILSGREILDFFFVFQPVVVILPDDVEFRAHFSVGTFPVGCLSDKCNIYGYTGQLEYVSLQSKEFTTLCNTVFLAKLTVDYQIKKYFAVYWIRSWTVLSQLNPVYILTAGCSTLIFKTNSPFCALVLKGDSFMFSDKNVDCNFRTIHGCCMLRISEFPWCNYWEIIAIITLPSKIFTSLLSDC